MTKGTFTLRVYGLLIEGNKILLSDEYYLSKYFTKFPGGGIELGEGTIDCLKREFKEETGIEIEVKDHFYTTDFFQQSAFNPEQQVISIYYFVDALQQLNIADDVAKFNFTDLKEERSQSLRWISLDDFTIDDVTFPIDKKVAGMLLERKRI